MFSHTQNAELKKYLTATLNDKNKTSLFPFDDKPQKRRRRFYFLRLIILKGNRDVLPFVSVKETKELKQFRLRGFGSFPLHLHTLIKVYQLGTHSLPAHYIYHARQFKLGTAHLCPFT